MDLETARQSMSSTGAARKGRHALTLRKSASSAPCSTPVFGMMPLPKRTYAVAERDGPDYMEDLDAETILWHSVVVVAGAQNPWVRRRRIKLADLVDEKWILLPPEMPESEYTASAFRAHGLDPARATVTSYSLHMRAALLERGDLLSAFPRTSSVTIPPSEPGPWS